MKANNVALERSSRSRDTSGGAPVRVLDETTIAQIAAGEVIERPVSVVKELVENSLDAGTSSVTVELVDGGHTAISVIDDGAGMSRDDLALAPARHATSKLTSARDLFAVSTLGFRGEGLASIAAAGNLEIISRPPGEELGARIEAAQTAIGSPETIAAPPGTKVVVRDLFAWTPARREFLKSPRAEFTRVSDYLSRLALGWPHVAFRLRHAGRDVWTLPATRDPIDRVELVFGRTSRGELLAVLPDGDFAKVRVTGYVSRPGSDRPNRNHQSFFVNGRLVRSAALGAAWLAGYASFGMTGRYPFGVLLIDLPPDEVDVNVHPTKIEVRFASQATVFDAVRVAVARTLRAAPIVSSLQGAVDLASTETASTGTGAVDFMASGTAAFDFSSTEVGAVDFTSTDGVRFLGQIDRTYILAATHNGLTVVDQHAAHERIAYEALQERSAAQARPLLLPTIVELTPAQAALFHEFEPELRAAGVVIEQFGERAYRVMELPGNYDHRRFDLPGLLDDLAADDAAREGLAHHNRVLATIACHSVVRAHESLTGEEQAALYTRLLHCKDPHTCPHGRPTMLRLDAASFSKAFHRQ